MRIYRIANRIFKRIIDQDDPRWVFSPQGMYWFKVVDKLSGGIDDIELIEEALEYAKIDRPNATIEIVK